MWWSCGSGRIELQITKAQAASVSHAGRCDSDVEALFTIPAIRRQLNRIDAWDDTELADVEANKRRLLWIAGNDIMEGLQQP